MPFVWKQRGIQTQSAQTVAGDAGASMGVQRKKEREGRLGSAEE